MQSRLLQGARLAVYIDGRRFAQAYGFRFRSDTVKNEIRGIDNPEAYELATATASVSGSLSLWRLIGDGGAEGAGFTVAYPELTRERYFSIVLVERATQLVVFQADRCSLVSQSWDMPSKNYVTGTLDFKAINFSNETQVLTQ